MKKTYSYTWFLVFFFTLSISISSLASPLPNTYAGSIQNPEYQSADLYAKVLYLLNQHRESLGLTPLIIDTEIDTVANTRALEISRFFSHTRPDNRRYSTAFTDANISFRYCGEILAYGYSTPEEVVNAWMASPGHRSTILSSRYSHVGISHMISEDLRDYWVVEFLSR